MQRLLTAIRQACTPQTWSRGVELARSQAVYFVRATEQEVELRVAPRGGLAAPKVTLWPVEEEWSCDCNSDEDACAHACAAAIAWKQSVDQGLELPRMEEAGVGHVAYELSRGRDGALAIQRYVIAGGNKTPVARSLRMLVDGGGPRFVATPIDNRFERELGGFVGGEIPPGLVAKVFEVLGSCENVTYERRPVRLCPPSAGLRVRVFDHANHIVARIEQDPLVSETFTNRVMRLRDDFCPITHHGLSDRLFSDLRKGLLFEVEDVAQLVSTVLPELERQRLPCLIESTRVPSRTRLRPRLDVLTVLQDGGGMSVLARVVYGEPAIARVDGDRLTVLSGDRVPVRDLVRERALGALAVKRLGLEIGVREEVSGQRAMELAARLAAMEKDGELSGLDELHKDFSDRGTLSARLETSGEDYDLWFELEGVDDDDLGDGDEGDGLRRGRAPRVRGRADAAAVIRAWTAGESYVRLLDGGFGRLPSEFMAMHGHLVADLLAARDVDAQKRPKTATIDLGQLCAVLDQPPPPSYEALRRLIEQDDLEDATPVALDVNAELRPYQLKGVSWLNFMRTAELGALLADDMGLGKTLQALCAIRGRTLVIAPTSVLHNWRSEAERFRPSLRVCVYHGPSRSLDVESDVVVTSYALLRLDLDKLSEQDWDTVVLDEAQTIKNPTSQVAQAAYRLRASSRIALTGTPIENRVEELWSLMHFLNPGTLGGRADFLDRYGRGIAAGDEVASQALRRKLRPFVMRRLKRDVARELPPRTEVVLRCELDADERRVYDAVRAATQESIAEKLGRGGEVMAVLEALLRLRQAACHPALVPRVATSSASLEVDAKGDSAKAEPRSSSKLELLTETLLEAMEGGHRSLVFSQWTSLLDLVEPRLRAAGISFVRLDGSTKDRAGVVATFQAEDGPPVMLVSLKAGGAGLNLTAADHVFLLDPWWNPAVEDQAADRAHRIGQERPVIVHRLIAEGTVEERILELQARKRQIAAATLDDAAAASAITKEELLALLE